MNWSDAVEILKNFRKQRVVVMGGVTLDRHLWGTLTRMPPEGSRPYRCQTTHRLFAGRRGQCGCDRCR
jgi:bifunctional ADP-heptose synthase (sugar kinase/adenylyltransferase)